MSFLYEEKEVTRRDRFGSGTETTEVVKRPKIAGWVCLGLGSLLLLYLCTLGALAGCKEYNRYQKRADAENQVQVTRTQIEVAEEQAKVNRAQIEATKAEAEKRYQESIGIRKAQEEIDRTLTPLYVQHELVQALEHASNNGNSMVWIPTNQNGGIPTVVDPLQQVQP